MGHKGCKGQMYAEKIKNVPSQRTGCTVGSREKQEDKKHRVGAGTDRVVKK